MFFYPLSERSADCGSLSAPLVYALIGFRVAEVPEPGTLSLVALGRLEKFPRSHR